MEQMEQIIGKPSFDYWEWTFVKTPLNLKYNLANTHMYNTTFMC